MHAYITWECACAYIYIYECYLCRNTCICVIVFISVFVYKIFLARKEIAFRSMSHWKNIHLLS